MFNIADDIGWENTEMLGMDVSIGIAENSLSML